LDYLLVLGMSPNKFVALDHLIDSGADRDGIDSKLFLVLKAKGVLDDHCCRLQKSVKHVQVVSLNFLIDLLIVMLELVSEDVKDFKQPVDCDRRSAVDEALKELHHVRVEQLVIALSRDYHFHIAVFCLVIILEMVANAVQ
jgi:hypothetical protein